MVQRLAVIKTAWSDTYRGGPVEGDFKFVDEHKEGHERFNFQPGPGGRFYGYLPPIGDGAVPKPLNADGWLLAFVAKRPKKAGLYLVGWYEDASFQPTYQQRPEYDSTAGFVVDRKGDRFVYCIEATKAFLIPRADRKFKFKGDRIKSTPIAYLKGGKRDDPWRHQLADALVSEIKRVKSERT